MSRFIRALAGANKDVIVILSDSTEVVQTAYRIHQTTPVATAALGRVLTAVQMMGTFLKGEKSSVSMMISGSAHLKKVYGYQDARGHLKGYVSKADVPVLIKENGKLDVGGVIGRHGKLIVTRDYGFGQPFIGQSDLVSGEIAEDLTHYYAHSEQQPSVISLGVHVDPDGKPTAAGGLMIQPLPNCSEASIAQLEDLLPDFRPMSEMIGSGEGLEAIMRIFFKDMPYQIMLDGHFEYSCDCNWEKTEGALITLGIQELEKILKEDGHIELGCHFCSKKYDYGAKEMQRIIKELRKEMPE